MLNFLWRKKNIMIVKLTSSLIFLDTIMYLSFFSPDIDSNDIGKTSRRKKFAVY